MNTYNKLKSNWFTSSRIGELSSKPNQQPKRIQDKNPILWFIEYKQEFNFIFI